MRLAIIFGTLILSLLILIPSFTPETFFLNRYLPAKKLNLGLDLRGGIHVVLGVEVEKALDVEIDKFMGDLQTRAKDKNIPISTIQRAQGERGINLTFANPQDVASFETLLKDFYGVLTVADQTSTSMVVKLEPQHEAQIAQMSLEQAKEIIRSRVDEFGVAEPVVQIQGSDRILIQLPGIQDPERAIQLIGRTALLEFKMVDDSMNIGQLETIVDKAREQAQFKNNFTRADLERLNKVVKAQLPAGTEISFEKRVDPRSKEVALTPYLLKEQTVLTGSGLEDARVSYDDNTRRPEVALRFTKLGAETFEKVTEANVGKLLAITLDGVVMSAPVIRHKIPAFQAAASIQLGNRNQQEMMKEAKDLSLVLRTGALPAPVEILENRTVGASLGEDSIRQGIFATLIGALMVILFMMIYYRWSGFLADVVLVVNISMLLAMMALFQATLTLPGIAGIVLTIGMAVDANVIIIERIREEMRAGKRVRAALEAGYMNAHRAILDSNLTTVIAGVVLYNFGTGPIRGFAVTLILGLVANYIASVWFSRWIYDWYLARVNVERLSV